MNSICVIMNFTSEFALLRILVRPYWKYAYITIFEFVY